MELEEKYKELVTLLNFDQLESEPYSIRKNEADTKQEMVFIMIDNISISTPDISAYAKLESNS